MFQVKFASNGPKYFHSSQDSSRGTVKKKFGRTEYSTNKCCNVIDFVKVIHFIQVFVKLV